MAGLTPEDLDQINAYAATATPEEAAEFRAKLYMLRATPGPGTFSGFPKWLVVLIAVWFGLLETADKLPQLLLSYPRYEAALAETQAKMLMPQQARAALDKATSDAIVASYSAEAAPNQPRMVAAQADKAALDADAAKLQPALTAATLEKARNDATASALTPDLTTAQLEKAKNDAKASILQPALITMNLAKTVFETQAATFQPKLNEVQLAKLGVETRTAVYQQGLTAANAVQAEQQTAMSNAAMAMVAPMLGGMLKQFGINLPLDQIAPQLGIINPAARTQDLQSALPGNQSGAVVPAANRQAPIGDQRQYERGVADAKAWQDLWKKAGHDEDAIAGFVLAKDRSKDCQFPTQPDATKRATFERFCHSARSILDRMKAGSAASVDYKRGSGWED